MKSVVKREAAHRVQFDLLPDEIACIERIAKHMHAASMNEVVRRSIMLMGRVIGSPVFVEGDEGRIIRLEII
jgi:hypothetical protein